MQKPDAPATLPVPLDAGLPRAGYSCTPWEPNDWTWVCGHLGEIDKALWQQICWSTLQVDVFK